MNEIPELFIKCCGAGAEGIHLKISGVGVARLDLQYPQAKYSGALDLKTIAALHEWSGRFLEIHKIGTEP